MLIRIPGQTVKVLKLKLRIQFRGGFFAFDLILEIHRKDKAHCATFLKEASFAEFFGLMRVFPKIFRFVQNMIKMEVADNNYLEILYRV